MSQSTGQTNRPSWKPDAAFILAVILTAGVVALGLGGSYLIRLAEYWGGMDGTGVGQGFLLGLAIKPLMILVSLLVLIALAARLIRGPVTRRRLLLSVAMPVICLLAICVPTWPAGGLAAAHLRGFERRMLKMADIDTIQQWLSVEGGKYTGREYRDKFPQEFPACLVELGAPMILFRGVTIEFCWYVPHGGTYGLVVGPPSMETPPEGVIRLDDGWHEFRRPVKPGACVFSRG